MNLKRKKVKWVLISTVIFMVLSPLPISMLQSDFNYNNITNRGSTELGKPNPSDIAGSDLYAEAIRAYIAGKNSLIKHSLFTNDTNIIKNLDLEDPAFSRCNIYLSTANNKTTDIFPYALSERGIEDQFKYPLNSFIGFLYYDKELNSRQAEEKSERAFKILSRKFKLDFIHVNSSQMNYYPFIAYYPKWSNILQEFTENIPKDGYWKAFDLERLSSRSYTNNKHLSLSYIMINSPDLFEGTIDFGNDQLDFNRGASMSPFLKGGDTADLFSQISSISGENEDLFGNTSAISGENETTSTPGFGNMTMGVGNFTLLKNSHYSILEVQYQGLDEGIRTIKSNEYEFNLFEALGYKEESLEPSEKVYISLDGAFLSELDINVLCTEITDTIPRYSEFSKYLLEQLAFLLSLTDSEFDVETLEDYSFEVFWKDFGGLKKNYMNIVNLQDDYDIINFLPILGFTGLPSFPSGILNPLTEFKLKYKTDRSEPNIRLTNTLIGGNAGFGAYRTFDFNITAENVGNTTAYGTPTAIPIDLETILPVVIFLEGGNPNYADDLQDTLWEIVDVEYPEYKSLEEFFNFDKDPRIFHFDTNGDGSNDYYFPDPFNISNLYPYNENMDNVSRIILQEYPQLLSQLGMTRKDIETAFTNSYSVWNDGNWALDPGEGLSYLEEDYDISENDTYTDFYSFNFTINEGLRLPRVIHGREDQSTNPSMALTQDNESWIIYSEEYQGQEAVNIQFLAQNTTAIDFENNTLNRFSLTFNISDTFEDVEIELFNFTSETFIDLGEFLLSVENSSRTYGLTKYNNSIDDVFKNPDNGNYAIIFRLQKQSNTEFNVTIENIDLQFLTRDVNPITLQSTVKYSSASGWVRYIKYSNSVTLSTGNMSSIVSYASLSNYNGYPGNLNTYKLRLKNIGTAPAKNITVKVPLPGIIKDLNGFNLDNNYLIYRLDCLSPNQAVKLNFTYYVPNSALFQDHIIRYNNSKYLKKGNSTKLTSLPNNAFSVAPVNFENSLPYLKTIRIWLNSSTNGPKIKESFNLTVNIKNLGPFNLSIGQINISSSDEYEDLKKTTNEMMIFENISYNKVKSFTFKVNKTDWKGYFYPAITKLENSNSKTLQIQNSEPLIIGTISFDVIKSVNIHELEIGDLVYVDVTIKNTGSICVKDIKIDDVLSYSGHFSLVDGKFIKSIDCLKPDETTSLSYTIRSTSEAEVTLNGAIIYYDYLYSLKKYSNSISMKVITPKLRQYLRVILPNIIGLSILGGFLYYRQFYKKKRLESERTEIKILKKGSRDTILSVETTGRDYFKRIFIYRNQKEGKKP